MKVSVALLVLIFCNGCSLLFEHESGHAVGAEPVIAVKTSTQRLLEELPPATAPIVVAVYSFDDQTGQHKPDELPQYSRAVTQGGLAFLKKALWDAGNQRWFRVLERGGLAHLLKEREIIRSVRAAYRSPNGGQLPDPGPLLYSGLLLEGGIVAYESNELTGGIGARYLGVGGSTEYRRDVVTVSLRAVSVTTGEVLAVVTTSKTIFSMGMSGGVFKYVTFDELLEGEAGFTINEPPQLAVRQATELAVYALIMKGYEKGLWDFADEAAGRTAYDMYTEHFKVLPNPPKKQTRSKELSGAGLMKQQRADESSRKQAERHAKREDKKLIRSGTLRAGGKERELCHPELPQASSELKEGYYFQIAALEREQPNAEFIHQSFVNDGLPVKLQQATVGGTPYCRILVGPYLDATTALSYSGRISEVAASCLPGDTRPFLKKIK